MAPSQAQPLAQPAHLIITTGCTGGTPQATPGRAGHARQLGLAPPRKQPTAGSWAGKGMQGPNARRAGPAKACKGLTPGEGVQRVAGRYARHGARALLLAAHDSKTVRTPAVKCRALLQRIRQQDSPARRVGTRTYSPPPTAARAPWQTNIGPILAHGPCPITNWGRKHPSLPHFLSTAQLSS